MFVLLDLVLPTVAVMLVYRRRQGYLVLLRNASTGATRPFTPLRFLLYGMYLELCAVPFFVVLLEKFEFRMMPEWTFALFVVCCLAGTALFTGNCLHELRHGVPAPRERRRARFHGS